MENLIAELRIFATYKLPLTGWLPCNGAIYQVNMYRNLFSLIGNQFGGDGVSTFRVPDLRGFLPVGSDGAGFIQGGTGGAATSTLAMANMPAHAHVVNVVSAATSNAGSPLNNYFGKPGSAGTQDYATTSSGFVTMDGAMLGQTGKASPVSTVQPVLGLMFAIATEGVYPSEA